MAQYSITTASPWYLQALQISRFWREECYGQGVNVGIIDTGIDPSNAGFGPNRYASWKDFSFPKEPEASDQAGHGTLVAGILGANRGNLLGVAPKANLHIARVKEFPASAVKAEFVADAIGWLVQEKGCTLINCSMGLGGAEMPTIAAAISLFRDQTLMVAPIGNRANKTEAQFPAIHADTLAVGATDRAGTPSERITVDLNQAEVWAPGESIALGFVPKWTSAPYYEGTSFATALVSGLGALLQQQAGYQGALLKQALIDHLNPLFSSNPI